MTAIQIIPVENSRQRKAFLNFFYDLYRDCPYAVPYLYLAEKFTLKPGSNPAFAFCEAQCFLALKDGKVAGRVAAIINRRANEHWKRKMVRFDGSTSSMTPQSRRHCSRLSPTGEKLKA